VSGSSRSRPADDQLTSTWAAVTGPTPGRSSRAHQPRCGRVHQPGQLAADLADLADLVELVNLGDLGVQLLDTLGQVG
jgi:hypothetical protein